MHHWVPRRKRERERNRKSSNHKGREQEKKGTEELQNSQKTIFLMAISPYLLIILLNVNGLYSPIKG